MRRIVRDYVLAALSRQKSEIERFVTTCLEYGEAVPITFGDATAAIDEISRLKITPRHRGDFPETLVTVTLRVHLAAVAARRQPARGVRTAAVPGAILGRHRFVIDVELTALGVAVARGYDLKTRSARLLSWWGTAPSMG